jgi:hypothetical protein
MFRDDGEAVYAMAVDLFQAVWSHSAVSVAGRSIDLGDGTRLPEGHKAVCAH